MTVDTLPLPESAISAISPETVAWMAGLLEGEGYFFCNSGRLGVRLVMTDEDVVHKFAELWQVLCRPLEKRESHHKPPFLAHLPSKKAHQCMRLILPFCGERRTSRILEALSTHEKLRSAGILKRSQTQANCSDEELSRQWAARAPGISFRAFCQQIGTRNRARAQRRLQRLGLLEGAPVTAEVSLPGAVEWTAVAPELKTAWLAGLLEGEGSFLRKGGCPCVKLRMTDEDVVARYAETVTGAYTSCTARKVLWKDSYDCQVSGDRAASVMERILPWMGERRAAKIRECLEARAISQKRLADEKAAFAIAREATLPAAELTARWTTRVAPANLSSFAREYGVHPQIMKNRLVELSVYSSPAYKSRTDVTHICGFCSNPFVRKASSKGGQYCSRICSGRAVQQRRTASLKVSIDIPGCSQLSA